MINRASIGAHDYMQVRAQLIRDLDGYGNGALVLTRIAYRLDPDRPCAATGVHDGWWRVNLKELANETGFKVAQIQRILTRLRTLGHIEALTEQEDGVWDRTLSYRIVWADAGVDLGASDGGLSHDQEAHNGAAESDNVHDAYTHNVPPTKTVVKTKSFTSGDESPDPPSADVAPTRQDVNRLCTHLRDRIVGNGSKAPTIGKRWQDAARLMLDNDGRTEDQVHRAIDWCQDDEFWRANIQSMPKLRDKYEQLRLQALRARRPGQPDKAAIINRRRSRIRDAQDMLASSDRKALV
jgi:hypothetical protein